MPVSVPVTRRPGRVTGESTVADVRRAGGDYQERLGRRKRKRLGGVRMRGSCPGGVGATIADRGRDPSFVGRADPRLHAAGPAPVARAGAAGGGDAAQWSARGSNACAVGRGGRAVRGVSGTKASRAAEAGVSDEPAGRRAAGEYREGDL